MSPDSQDACTECKGEARTAKRAAAVALIATALSFVMGSAVAWTVLTTDRQVDDNTGGIAEVKRDAKVAKTDAKKAKTTVARTSRRVTRVARKNDVVIRVLRRDYGVRGLPGKAGRTGPRGSIGRRGPGPTETQIANAVVAYCATHICALPPTSAQVLAAVQEFCSNERCRGLAGRDGRDVTQDDVDQAVVRYCNERNQCAGASGAVGPVGPQGPPGLPGPTITSITLNGVTYVCSDPEGDGSVACTA